MLVNLFLTLSLLLGLPTVQTAPEGVITVNVVGENGAPLVDATVWALSQDGRARVSPVPACLTDWAGTCSCNHLPAGKYLITAFKEADGYPNGEFPLFNRNRAHLIAEILPSKLNVHVSYQAGPKAATIVIGAVDDATGARIKNAGVILRSPTDQKIWMSTSLDANSRVLIPPDQDVLVEVSAEGYKPWQIGTQPGATHPNALRLHPQESRQFTARLLPK
jgi:hypothetical protein